MNSFVRKRAYELLYGQYGNNAEFRDGQLEAIEKVLAGNRILCVQKTGWGKSLIYFLATKILREQGNGLCLIISPLLALMSNQIVAAEAWGLRAATISSSNTEEWESIIKSILANKIDVLFISPERLANQEFMTNVIQQMRSSISMLVVDEAHCISDWGHDFRLDYRRIVDIIKYLPPNVPLLATTATANDRVIKDICEQFGKHILVLRGSLTRDSLYIQVIRLNKKEERLAWISEHIKQLPGTGIIYCLTKRDCYLVKNWLKNKCIEAAAYTADLNAEERSVLEESFYKNKIKVLVATVAFGMGIDKPDIGFVIHFQKPGNVVAYYQQIGRAGRNIAIAYAILLAGNEDDNINEFFIKSAFPSYQEMDSVIRILDASDCGLKIVDLQRSLNMSYGQLVKSLKFLLLNGDIYLENKKYYKAPKIWKPDFAYSSEITATRQAELGEMNTFINLQECYMQFITGLLNDKQTHACGHCGNCFPSGGIDIDVSEDVVAEAKDFLQQNAFSIKPRKKWPVAVSGTYTILPEETYKFGYALSSYEDSGLGSIVSRNKYHDGKFSEILIKKSHEFLVDKCKEWDIKWITAIPSLRRPTLVPSFAKSLAKKLQIPYFDSIRKVKNAEEQKCQNNSIWQYKNASASFGISEVHSGNVLLVDDMVDSRWTLTVCANKLIANGSGAVYVFALANTGNAED